MDRILRWLEEKGGTHVTEAILKLQSELQSAREDAAIARGDRDDAFERLTTAKGELREASAELAEVKAELQAETDKGRSALTYRTKLEAENTALQREIDRLDGEVGKLEGALSQSEQANAELHTLLDKANEAVDAAKKKVSDIADFVNARK